MNKKSKKKIYTKTLYTYVTPANNQWVRTQAKKAKMSYSAFLNNMLNSAREKAANV